MVLCSNNFAKVRIYFNELLYDVMEENPTYDVSVVILQQCTRDITTELQHKCKFHLKNLKLIKY